MDTLLPYALLAAGIELAVLAVLAPRATEPVRPITLGLIEAQLVTLPAAPAPRVAHATTVSTRPAARAQTTSSPPVAENVGEGKSAPPPAPVPKTHGALALHHPAPVLPAYLTDRNLDAAVVIEFSIKNTGEASPRLIASSDNEELDALALSTVKRWRFAPAEHDGIPVDSTVRLRISFEVRP